MVILLFEKTFGNSNNSCILAEQSKTNFMLTGKLLSDVLTQVENFINSPDAFSLKAAKEWADALPFTLKQRTLFLLIISTMQNIPE